MDFQCPMCKQKLTTENMIFKNSPKCGPQATTYTLKCNCGYINISDGSYEKIKTKQEKDSEFKQLVISIQCYLTANCLNCNCK